MCFKRVSFGQNARHDICVLRTRRHHANLALAQCTAQREERAGRVEDGHVQIAVGVCSEVMARVRERAEVIDEEDKKL